MRENENTINFVRGRLYCSNFWFNGKPVVFLGECYRSKTWCCFFILDKMYEFNILKENILYYDFEQLTENSPPT